MKLRICCAGASGTGKSTLSEYISKTYNIPFITTSTKPLWDKYCISSHHELIEKTISEPQWGLDFQHEVLDYRINLLSGVDEFVTDRSPIDNLVYFLLQNVHSVDEEQTVNYIKDCNMAMNLFTGLICFPFNDQTKLENDGKRIDNKYYQLLVSDTFQLAVRLMDQNRLKLVTALTLPMWDWDQRVKQTGLLITHLKNKKNA